MTKCIKNSSALVLIIALIFTLNACAQEVADVTQETAETPVEIVDQRVEYYSGVTAHQILMREAFFELNSLIQYPAPEDDQWMFRLNVEIARIQRILREEFGTICPIEYDDANIHYLQALENLQYFVDNYPTALEDMDTSLMDECRVALMSGVDMLDLAVEELQRQEP